MPGARELRPGRHFLVRSELYFSSWSGFGEKVRARIYIESQLSYYKNMAEYESKEITWEGPEFEYRPKDISWYWISIIVAVICIGFAAWQKNFLFGLFVLVAEILILTWGNQEPKMFNFRLTEKGLFVGDKKFYPYQDMEAFSCHGKDGSDLENIVFKFNKHLRRPLRITFLKKSSEEIQSLLAKNVKEINYEPSLIDSIEEFIRF